LPTAVLDGLRTRYEIVGSGPTVLMFSPGGFNATLENWRTPGVYRTTRMLDQLSGRYSCITFDRRESGESGGRVERVTWRHYAEQGRALLDHLGIERTHVMGGCVGCSVAAVFALEHPERTASMVLYSPAGGAQYRLMQHHRFAAHAAYAAEHGLAQVVKLAQESEASFSEDPRVGPWSTVLRTDSGFARSYAELDRERYRTVLSGLVRVMFDRDTVPGPEPEDLLVCDVPALVVPGQDQSHATSAARFLHECLPGSQYWDVPVVDQTSDTAPQRVMGFLDEVGAAGGS
jgi:pimeloyl-ACP methyl ester carboxylesterase